MSGQDGRALLARIKPTKRVEKIQVSLRPDLVALYDELDTELQELAAGKSPRLGAGGVSAKEKALAEKIVALEDEIVAASVWFTLEQLDRPDWQALLDNHPPRDDFTLDQYAGYNRDAVLDQAIHDCLIDPVFEDCADPLCEHKGCGSYQQFEKTTPGGEWQELRNIANLVNSGVVESPKSVRASEILNRRAPASEQPDHGA